LKKPQDAAGTNFFDYDLVCAGKPTAEDLAKIKKNAEQLAKSI